MLGLLRLDHIHSITLKHNCLIISESNSGLTDVYSFDLVGRLWTAMRNNISYRQGLDGKFIAKWIDHNDERQRKWLTINEALTLLNQARDLIQACMAKLMSLSPNNELDTQLFANIIRALNHIQEYDLVARENEIIEFHKIYKPVGILPPDQYMAVLLQLTEGCSFNNCTFCTFYKDQIFKIKSHGEFQAHIQSVKSFLQQGLSLRRTIFLGGANALVTPMKILLPSFELIHESLDVDQLGGIFAFLDSFAGDKKNLSDYRLLSKSGIKRVYIGLESGCDSLLEYLKKPGTAMNAVATVNKMKQAGIAVGVIILLGAGGKKYSDAHVRDTVKTLNRMPLDAEDIIYFSELVELKSSSYQKLAYADALKPLSHQEIIQQQEQIESKLVFATEDTPHISRYDVREFVF